MSDRRALMLSGLSVLGLAVYVWIFIKFPYENVCILFCLSALTVTGSMWRFFFNLWKGNGNA